MAKTEEQGKIKLIYIGGYGHSGSTILEILLSCNAKTKGLGELFRFGEALNSRYAKSLFNENPECSEMYSRIESKLKDLGETLDSFEEIKNCEQPGRAKNIDLERYNRLWTTFFRAIQNGDSSVKIIDSSKSSFAFFKRFKLLQSIHEIDAYMVHLVRHPKPILIRMMKHRKNKEGKISSGKQILYLIKYSLSWLFSNLWPLLSSNREKYVRISFETLCEQPEKTLKKVQNSIGLDLDETIRRINNNEPLPITCAITGNMRVRKNKDLKFQPSKKTIPKSDFKTTLVSWMVIPFYYILR